MNSRMEAKAVAPYYRVIPRDLFNEANLLKCMGRLYINLEQEGLEGCELVQGEGCEQGFDIGQDEDTGALFVSNVTLEAHGIPQRLIRPLNAREAYPLLLVTEDDDEIPVFNEDGSFSEELKAHIERPANMPGF